MVRKNIEMPLLKYFTLAVALSRVAAEGPCVDEPDATLPGGWDCARIAEYIAGSDVHSCSWAGPWLSVMVAPKLAEEAAAKNSVLEIRGTAAVHETGRVAKLVPHRVALEHRDTPAAAALVHRHKRCILVRPHSREVQGGREDCWSW